MNQTRFNYLQPPATQSYLPKHPNALPRSYVGPVDNLPAGYWVGVRYDEPLGRNDGTTGGVGGAPGKRYFTCPNGYGAFVRPNKLTVGDFPPIDEFASDDEI